MRANWFNSAAIVGVVWMVERRRRAPPSMPGIGRQAFRSRRASRMGTDAITVDMGTRCPGAQSPTIWVLCATAAYAYPRPKSMTLGVLLPTATTATLHCTANMLMLRRTAMMAMLILPKVTTLTLRQTAIMASSAPECY